MHPLLHHVLLDGKGGTIANSEHLQVVQKKYGLYVGGTVRADLVDLLAKPLLQQG
jgi:hypothetical protein